MSREKCNKCVCKTCFYKEDCCPDCDGAILGCEEYTEMDIYNTEILKGDDAE